MRKLLFACGAGVGVALLARRCKSHLGEIDFGKMVDRMPENAPPKWMFRNVSAIRENTERILAALEAEHASVGDGGRARTTV